MDRGPVGARFAENLRTLRKRHGWDQARLSEELANIGHPIGLNSVSRMEKGERRADVSDFVALAVALNCAPAMLFLPASDPGSPVPLAAGIEAEWRRAWEWAHGEWPLRQPVVADPDVDLDLDAAAAEHQWTRDNTPHVEHKQFTVGDVFALDDDPVVQTLLRAFLDTLERDYSPDDLLEYLHHTVRMRDALRSVSHGADERTSDGGR